MAYERGTSSRKLANNMHYSDQQGNTDSIWQNCKTIDDLLNTIRTYYNNDKIQELKTNVMNVKTVFDMSKKKHWTGKASIKKDTIPFYQENYGSLVSLFDLLETLKSVSANEKLEHTHNIREKESKIESLQNENQKLNTRLQQLKDQASNYDKKLQQANKEIIDLKKEVSGHSENEAKLVSDINSHKQEVNRLQKVARDTEDELASLNKVHKTTSEDLKQQSKKVTYFQELVKKKDEECQNKNKELSTRLQQLKDQASNCDKKLQQANKEIIDLKKEVSGHSEKEAKLVSDINSHKQEVNRLKNTIRDKEDKIASLNEVCKTTSEDLKQQNKTLQELMKKKDEEYKQLANDHAAMKINIKEKDKHLQDIKLKLAAELSSKLSEDETTAKNRPINVSEEYQVVCSNQWLDAKGAIDESVKDVPDYQKLQLLCQIIKISEKETKFILNKIYKCLLTHMSDPVNFVLGKQSVLVDVHDRRIESQIHTTYGEVQLPTALSKIFGDQLIVASDNVDLSKLIQHVHSTLNNINEGPYDSQLRHIWDMSKVKAPMKEYLSSVTRITWKMANQRPPMEFKCSETFLGGEYQEMFWNSDTVPIPVVINVFPMLYHRDSLMAKGKVLLLDPKKQEKPEIIGCD